MKNKFSAFFVAILVTAAGLGCGWLPGVQNVGTESNTTSNSSNSNKTLTDKAVDATVGEQKVGIPECDEAIEILTAQTNDPDDNFVTKAVKQTALNQFREQLRKSLEDSKTDKKQVANFCRDFKNNLEKSASNSK